MDHLNVQKWASSLRQSPRNLFQNLEYCQLATAITSPPIPQKYPRRNPSRQYSVPTSPEFNLPSNESFSPAIHSPPFASEGSVGRQYDVRNVSSSLKIKENKAVNDNHKYSFTLNLPSSRNEPDRSLKPRFYKFDMTTKSEAKITTSSNVPFHDTTKPNIRTPSSDHPETDELSDAGTYIIDDDVDAVQDPKSKAQLVPSSSILKRYVNQTKTRHGTFELRGAIAQTIHTVNRPVVDANIPRRELSQSSNSSPASSLHSFSDDGDWIHSPSEIAISNKSSDQLSHTTAPPKYQIKPAECFVISPTFETKKHPATSASERKLDIPWRAKFAAKSASTNNANSSPDNFASSAIRPNPDVTEKQSSTNAPTRPHTLFQTNSSVSYSEPSSSRLTSSTSNILPNDVDDSLSKVPMTKSFFLRQQRSTVTTPTSKPVQSTKTSLHPPLKQATSVAPSLPSSSSQTNRAVELRRARAQAKIEELAQRTKKQLQKQESSSKNNIMSTSWHSNANSLGKNNSVNGRISARTTTKPTILSERENLSATRTISSAAPPHRPASASPNRPEQKLTLSEYRKPVRINQSNAQQSQRMTTSALSLGTEHCDTLRENGQRLAIRLIQLSSGILEKLKLNDSIVDNDTTVRELQKLVEKLQTVNQTLTTIDAALTGPINDDAFV
ncbi:unnamed protein product [Adineta ricciae]|uniref:Uncharacterized protein n=1 Tax=Adineta ricciae TaxID=249248 RepID=A0A814UNK7_ADIRI|nr:unnamed protein product [Adineta ricciae]